MEKDELVVPPGYAAEKARLRADISLLHERLVGRLVIAMAYVETEMQRAIWAILNIPIEEGRILTSRMDARRKLDLLWAFSKAKVSAELVAGLNEVLGELGDLIDDRNFIVHGTWGTMEHENYAIGAVPFAASLRAKSLPGQISVETFDTARMRKIIASARQVHKELGAWQDLLSASRNKSPAQPSGGS